jgi:hypothetical protein
MAKTTVHVIEIIKDNKLRAKESLATQAVRRFYPSAGPVKLYRTADGRIGFQLDVAVTAGDRKRLDDAYRAVMKVLGETRGRPRGAKTVQTKLWLPEPVYHALKRAAAASNSTMSGFVAELAKQASLSKAGVR